MRTLTQEQFIEKVKKVHEGKVLPLGTYTGYKSNMEFECSICGNHWSNEVGNVLKGQGCRKCDYKSRRKSDEDFKSKLKDKFDGKVINIQPYDGANNIIEFQCTDCGHKWTNTPHKLFHTKGCSKCNRNKNRELMKKIWEDKSITPVRKTHEEFIQEINKVHNGKIKVLGIYSASHKNMDFQCNDCDNTWSAEPRNILRGRSCPVCSLEIVKKKLRRTNEEFLIKLKEKHGNNLTPQGEYINSTTKMDFLCNNCGHVFKSTPVNLFQTLGCPECTMRRRKKKSIADQA